MPLHMTRRTKLAAAASFAAIAALSLSACSSTGGGGATAGPNDEVGVTLIVKTTTNPYFVSMEDAAQADAKKANVKLTLAAGKKDGDTDSQIQAIENAISRGDKGILITPNGSAVNNEIAKARKAGLYVIALDTVPDPADSVDITFATDNFAAGELIGKWTAAKLDGKKATIAMLDLFSDQIVSVDLNRDQGFLKGLGIAVPDKSKNGSEAKSGSYTGGKGGEYTIAGHQATQGAEDGGRSAMETLLSKNPDINVVYTINEPAAYGAYQALKAAGKEKDVTIVSIDGGCTGVGYVKDGIIGATAQQYPSKMASLGMEAIAKIARGGEKPKTTDGLDFFSTGQKLVTDQAQTGLESLTSADAAGTCWGK
ncbi:substrate-binding domain-containing protein [Microbacterium azadirachtae]|uniref:D-ribose-binding periplasmic protein n=2 Tax=Microbacterium azadirachtae TaxID=582680 RepID=A0A0F0KHH6_9MICO|nr:substrate-binding domain-containing protein [Microbacterium azadirachtae]KJL19894.1 D-ribose-binding periplasmic protein precursor [Microbacterium azadirachtae]SDL89106.1 fructose transport system substrate-binding protein [Microbacterium azadirachtae]SEG18376.1 fructose transport system substrate-binding protein [Microbacterium azadirachtae]SEG20710.1 fructose transport system substrate-binding protein [Microbacterium azadirachtae]